MVDTRGRFVWYELMTTDIDAARAFYTDVVGWRAHDAFAPGMHYTLFLSGENSLGGLMQLPGEATRSGGSSATCRSATLTRPPTKSWRLVGLSICHPPQLATSAALRSSPMNKRQYSL
jgi:hypothetical protein